MHAPGARLLALTLSVSLPLVAACSSGEGALGPAEAFLLLSPVTPAAKSPGGFALVQKLDMQEEPALSVARLAADGFSGEIVRCVHLAKQLVRGTEVNGKRYPDPLRASAALPLALVIGLGGEDVPAGKRNTGLAFSRWLRDPQEFPQLAWIGLPATLQDDRALIQSLSGRVAAHAASFVAGDDPRSAPLVEAFRMAMEVIAREWRSPRGGGTGVRSTSGTLKQRSLFSDIRENEAVMAQVEGRPSGLRPPAELLSDPRVTATVLYRLAQTRIVANRVGPPEMYQPFNQGPLPEGVSGGQVLGPIRNFVAKVFTAWSRATLAGHPPADGADLIKAYTAAFPDEQREVLRIFLVTTFAATVKPGGVSRKPEDATAAVAEIAALVEEVVAGRRTLRDAAGVTAP